MIACRGRNLCWVRVFSSFLTLLPLTPQNKEREDYKKVPLKLKPIRINGIEITEKQYKVCDMTPNSPLPKGLILGWWHL